MADALFTDFFGGTAGQAMRADGFPSLPVAAGYAEPTGSVRSVAIDGSTDVIRVPNASFSANTPTLGYRRVDRFETGGTPVWIISWTTIIAFAGGTISNLDDGRWSSCHISADKIYLGFYDQVNGLGNGVGSYLLRADLATGTIEAVTKITAAVSTISTASRDLTMKGDDANAPLFWEVDGSGQLVVYYGATTSSQTESGVARVVYSADLATVISEAVYFDTSQTVVPPWSPPIYVSEDASIYVGQLSANNMQIGLPVSRQIITLNTSMSVMGPNDFIFQLGLSSGATARRFNSITGGAVAVGRAMSNATGFASSNGAAGVNRPFVRRADLDNYLKQLVFNFSGIEI